MRIMKSSDVQYKGVLHEEIDEYTFYKYHTMYIHVYTVHTYIPVIVPHFQCQW